MKEIIEQIKKIKGFKEIYSSGEKTVVVVFEPEHVEQHTETLEFEDLFN